MRGREGEREGVEERREERGKAIGEAYLDVLRSSKFDDVGQGCSKVLANER